MENLEANLVEALSKGLKKAEENGALVLTTTVISDITNVLVESVKSSYTGGVLTPDEMFGVCNVLYHAVEDKRFYDWEMPTKCGYSSEEMKSITDKLRKSISV